MAFTHYIVVRRDLALGDVLAQLAHAAGESFYLFPGSSEKERSVAIAGNGGDHREVAGSSPALGAIFNPHETIAVVLGARNEHRLMRLEKALIEKAVGHVAVRETEGPHAGHLMAIGLVPGLKEALAPHLSEFHMLRELANLEDSRSGKA